MDTGLLSQTTVPPSLLSMKARGLWLAGIFAAVGCVRETCDLDDELESAAGSASRNCGFVPFGAVRDANDSCVVEALDEGQAFFASYETGTGDILGVAQDGAGTVQVKTLLSDPGGLPSITAFTCEAPELSEDLEGRPQGTLPLSCGEELDERFICVVSIGA
ncbi:MAG: hypothetical protein ACFB9M_16650 [Myxococcota bacterium]